MGRSLNCRQGAYWTIRLSAHRSVLSRRYEVASPRTAGRLDQDRRSRYFETGMDLREVPYSQRRILPTSSRHAATTDAIRAAKKAWVEVVWGAATKVQNRVRGIPEMVSGFRGVSTRAARPMRLTARQCFRIAKVYENAAADAMNVPRQQRAAFTRKARWLACSLMFSVVSPDLMLGL